LEPLLLVVLGAAAGLFGGLLGIGGGVIIVPALYLAGLLPLAAAVGTSLVVITGTSLLASAGYLRRGLVEVDMALEVEVGALLGAAVAAWAAPAVPERFISSIFALVLLACAARLVRPPHPGAADDPGGSRRNAIRLSSPAIGAASGLLGIGGGLLLVPILRLLGRLDIRHAVATSTLTVGWTASVAALVYLRRGDVSLATVPGLLLGVFLGAAAAPWLGARLPRRGLEIVFALVLLWTAVRMIWR
jgi:uncharacterized membrane protein YfcA